MSHKVLVVDDGVLMLDLVRDALAGAGFHSGVSPADESIEVLAASAAAAGRRKLTLRAQTRPPI